MFWSVVLKYDDMILGKHMALDLNNALWLFEVHKFSSNRVILCAFWRDKILGQMEQVYFCVILGQID